MSGSGRLHAHAVQILDNRRDRLGHATLEVGVSLGVGGLLRGHLKLNGNAVARVSRAGLGEWTNCVVGMARYDDSYQSQIARQLKLEPAARVRHLAPAWAAEGFDPIGVLAQLAGHARFVVIGDVAGALNGWPVMLGSRSLQVVSADSSTRRIEQVARRLGAERTDDGQDGQRRWLLPNGGELRMTPVVVGTGGYRDLARDAEGIRLASNVTVKVASLIDLIRIAEASPDPNARVHVPALWATLEERRRREAMEMAA